jgi:3-oxoacyl-[acyl-carrier protein] reductase
MYENYFENKVAFITGGSKGIGKAIVKKLASLGANVAFTYNSSEEQAREIVEELSNKRNKIKAYKMDNTNREMMRNTVNDVFKDFEVIDILVNNAGITSDGFLMLMSDENWDKVINTNLSSHFYITKLIIPNMLRRKGSIINISSVAGLIGVAGQTNYSATKAGLIGFTKSLSKEIASKKIRVNAIAPGYIKTDMLAKVNETVRSNFVKTVPLKRLGTGEDIANVVAFLASEESSYITGQTIVVDGGVTS